MRAVNSNHSTVQRPFGQASLATRLVEIYLGTWARTSKFVRVRSSIGAASRTPGHDSRVNCESAGPVPKSLALRRRRRSMDVRLKVCTWRAQRRNDDTGRQQGPRHTDTEQRMQRRESRQGGALREIRKAADESEVQCVGICTAAQAHLTRTSPSPACCEPAHTWHM